MKYLLQALVSTAHINFSDGVGIGFSLLSSESLKSSKFISSIASYSFYLDNIH